MIIALLIISILTLLACFLVYYKRKVFKLNWPILILPSVLSVVVIFLIFTTEAPLDVRYLEYPAKEIRHYPEWTETITGTEGNKGGYSVTHFDYYALIYEEKDSVEREKEIPKSTFEYYKRLWNSHPVEDTLGNNREYESYRWDEDMRSALTYTKTQPFYNYFRNILSIYNFSKITPQESFRLKLFQRVESSVEVKSGILLPRQPLIYGIQVPDSVSRSIGFISTLDHMFRPFLMVWIGEEETKSHILEAQKNYWNGGKDNEVVFCVCIENLESMKIVWSGSFSWATTKDFEDYVLYTSLEPGTTLKIDDYVLSLRKGYQNGLWHPRNFQSYSLARFPLNTILISLLCLVIIILDVILVVKFVKREGTSNY